MADVEKTSGVVGVAPAVLITSQLLYLGAAAGLRKNFKKWRHHSREKRIVCMFLIVVSFAVVQSLMLFLRDKHDSWAATLMTAGPLPILAPMVALMLYPVGEERMREKYRRNNAKWDSHPGNFIPIGILCNTWWKWIAYLGTTGGTFFITGYAYRKTDNLYPLLSSIALPAMAIFLRAGLPLTQRIEEIQEQCRGSCQEDIIIVPIIGHAVSTSLIIMTYHKRNGEITVERRQSIIAHTNYAKTNHQIISDSFRKRFTGVPGQIDEFIDDAKKVIELVTSIGGWFKLSEQCLRDRDLLRNLLDSVHVYNGCSTAMYCWTRAIVECAIRVAFSRQALDYDGREDLSLRTARDLFSFVVGEDVGEVSIFDSTGAIIPQEEIERMLIVPRDARNALAVAALLLDRMSLSRDVRVPQLMTLGRGYDIKITAKQGSAVESMEYSTDIALDNQALHGNMSFENAPSRIKALGREAHELADKAAHEIIAAEFVPANWTSFCVHRQHIFMYLLIYMGLSVVFVVFGQTQKDVV